MIKTRAWPVRTMYMLVAFALVISLMISAAPSQSVTAQTAVPVKAEWDRVIGPTTEGWVLAPESVTFDYATASPGEVAYAIAANNFQGDPWQADFYLLRSTDHAATWKHKETTEAVEKEVRKVTKVNVGDDTPYFELWKVACAPDDPEFVAVVVDIDTDVYVFISTDGGATFRNSGEVDEGLCGGTCVYDFTISPAIDGVRDIAVAGTAPLGTAGIWRSQATGTMATAWEDATAYLGWDDEDQTTEEFDSVAVVAVQFAPSWDRDWTILAVTVADWGTNQSVYLQSGIWDADGDGSWNTKANFKRAVRILHEVSLDWEPDPIGIGGLVAGITTPENYAGRTATQRYAWVWVNYWDPDNTIDGPAIGEIFRVRDAAVKPIQIQIDGMPWLTNVSYQGTIARGKAIAGLLGDGSGGPACDVGPCLGVQVFRNDDIEGMEICCKAWLEACKPPTGSMAMEAFFITPEKAYAVALGGIADYDESAWSFSFDHELPEDEGDIGDVWNQLSLINTHISFLSDVAVSPDCNKTMLVSVNLGPSGEFLWWPPQEPFPYCDSVWLHAVNLPEAEEYSGKWLRTWSGQFHGFTIAPFYNELRGLIDHIFDPIKMSDDWRLKRGLLRLNPEEITGDTVYLFDHGNDQVYYNSLETLACWETGTSKVSRIVDLAVKDADTIYVVGFDGKVSMSNDKGVWASWTTPVESKLDAGWTIAVHGDDVLVGGQRGEVSHSADGGETFIELTESRKLDVRGLVTVAFDSYFDANDMIYAAVGHFSLPAIAGDPPATTGGIYRWILDESTVWWDLGAYPTLRQLDGRPAWGCPTTKYSNVAYTGLVLDNPDGNTYTTPSTGGVLYASYVSYGGFQHPTDPDATIDAWYTGAARTLTPALDYCCDEADWDYLVIGKYDEFDDASFIMGPQALKICGCLNPDSYTRIFAIGFDRSALESSITAGPPPYSAYDRDDSYFGTVWFFVDCYSKWGPDLRNPAEGAVVPALLCAGCNNMPFAMSWHRMCDACNYQVQFATDSAFNELFLPNFDAPTPRSCIEGGWEVRPIPAADPSVHAGSWFLPGETYYWRVRSVMAETQQVIRSQWSPARSFTVALKAGTGVTLISPAAGATNVPRTNIAFTWASHADVDSYNLVLSPNADLSGSDGQYSGANTGYTFTGTLNPNTAYYWRVTGVKNGVAMSEATGTFRTAATAVFCSPQSGLCFNTEAELREHHEQLHKDAMKTPAWVWVIIAIGAVLVIVVIVLIFRTRRV